MIIYSVSIHIEKEIADEWKAWMLSKHIPDVLATGFFEKHSFHKLLDPEPEIGADTYNIQYECVSIDKLNEYRNKHAEKLQMEHTERYKDKFVAFRTILERL